MIPASLNTPAAQSFVDPDFANVVFLLHFEGSDGSTTFTDEKSNIWTAISSAQIDTGIALIGTSSLLCSTTATDCIKTPDDPKFNLGAQEWCIDISVRWSALAGSGDEIFFGQWNTGSNSLCSIIVGYDFTASAFFVTVAIGTTLNRKSTPYTISSGVKYDISVERIANFIVFYIDGIEQTRSSLGTGTITINNSNGVVSLGGLRNSSDTSTVVRFTGSLDEARLTVGQFIYDGSHIPSLPHPNS